MRLTRTSTKPQRKVVDWSLAWDERLVSRGSRPADHGSSWIQSFFVSNFTKYIHTRTHTHIHICIYNDNNNDNNDNNIIWWITDIIECVSNSVYTYVRAYMHTYKNACMHAYVHLCMCTSIRTWVHASMRTHLHTYLSRYVDTDTRSLVMVKVRIDSRYVHTYLRAYIQTHRQTDRDT